jgi:hypothetical protein
MPCLLDAQTFRSSSVETDDLTKLVETAVDLSIKSRTLRNRIGSNFSLSIPPSFSNLPDGLKLAGELQRLVAKSEKFFRKIEECSNGAEFMAEVKRTQIAVRFSTLESFRTDPIKLFDGGDFQTLEAIPELNFEADGCRLVDDISQRLKLLKL